MAGRHTLGPSGELWGSSCGRPSAGHVLVSYRGPSSIFRKSLKTHPLGRGHDSWSWEVYRLSPYGSWHGFLFFLRSLIYPLEFRYLLNFFFSLPRRLKIELTRKKNKTWIVMGLPSLNRSKDWKELFLVPTALQKSTSKISNFFFSKILEPLLASSESSESS